MTIPEILEALTSPEGAFPVDAVRAAVEQKEAITPELLRVLTEVAEMPDVFAQRDGYMLHLFALYLLAQFREKAAFPLTLRIVQAPGELPHELLGDTITEDLSRLLGSFFDGNAAALRDLAADPRVDEFVRAAVVETFLVLYHSGQMSREEVVEHYRTLLTAAQREETLVWSHLVYHAGLLPAPELRPEVASAEARDLGLGTRLVRQFEEELDSPPRVRRLRYELSFGLIDDAREAMEEWEVFGPPDDDDEEVDDFDAIYDLDEPSSEEIEGTVIAEGTHVRAAAKIGRNDPCPCGSGKKYKKCCLGKDESGKVP